MLWLQLRGRRLGGHKFRGQWTIDDYIADFCCVESRLIIEADGGQHNEQRDGARTLHLQSWGFRVLRFWNNDILSNLEGVLSIILKALGGEKKDSHPNPLPQAGEGA